MLPGNRIWISYGTTRWLLEFQWKFSCRGWCWKSIWKCKNSKLRRWEPGDEYSKGEPYCFGSSKANSSMKKVTCNSERHLKGGTYSLFKIVLRITAFVKILSCSMVVHISFLRLCIKYYVRASRKYYVLDAACIHRACDFPTKRGCFHRIPLTADILWLISLPWLISLSLSNSSHDIFTLFFSREEMSARRSVSR